MMDKSITKLAFLGLGVMGYPMAGHLAKAGHSVTVYNRTTAKAQAWVDEHGGSLGETPAEAARGAEVVMACVGNDDDLRSVCLGPDGAFATMSEGSTFVDHTTVSAAVTAELTPLRKLRALPSSMRLCLADKQVQRVGSFRSCVVVRKRITIGLNPSSTLTQNCVVALAKVAQVR